MATSLISSGIEGGVPIVRTSDELDLAVARTSISQRSQVRVAFEGGAGTGGPGAQYVLRLPNSGHVHDFGSGVLRFSNLQATMSAGAQPRFQNFAAAAIIQEVELRVGGKSVLTLPDFNLKASISHWLRSNPAASGDPVYGLGTGAQRQAWATQNRDYEVALSVLFPGLAHWPRWFFGAAEIHIRMADPTSCLEATAATTTPTYSFQSSLSYLELDVLTLLPGQLGELEKQVQQENGGRLAITFEGYRLSTHQIPAGTIQFDAVSPVKTANLKKALFVERTTATLATVTTLERLHDYPPNNLASFQGEVDSHQVPGHRIEFVPGTNSYAAYKFAVIQGGHGHHAGGGPAGSAADDSTRISHPAWDGTDPSGFSKNVVVLDFTRADPATGLLSGVNTASSASSTIVHLRYGAAGATATATGSLFLLHDVRISSLVGGSSLLVED